ncbi:MAG: response regulator [Nitrospirae bacterium]|nr:response regulator [Nitrospirota bacterium]
MKTSQFHTILIVDDNPDDVEISKMLIKRIDQNIRTEPALRGEVALKRLRSGGPLPSLILLDLKMPGMSGFDVLREIRADKQLRHIPVIVVTASSLEGDKKGSYDAGADGFIQKAFNMEQFGLDLSSIITRFLG